MNPTMARSNPAFRATWLTAITMMARLTQSA
jgi:hypothetical protein